MAQRKIVHKQFNSPIGLYSNDNVKETLDRELKTLNNGAVGIDFDDPSTTRTGNLAKSAVLAALEEEERANTSRKQGSTRKAVRWPPCDSAEALSTPEPISTGVMVAPKSQLQECMESQSFVSDVQYNKNPNVLPQQPPQQNSIVILSPPEKQCLVKPFSPLSPLKTAPSFGSPRGWNHVNPPRLLSNTGTQSLETKDTKSYSYQPQEAQTPSNDQSSSTYEEGIQQPFQGCSLRTSIQSQPAPVFYAQPIASTFQGGERCSGDSRWPPNKQQSELDNEARRKLAQGPVFRPKRVNKDYSGFFAQNALTATYPGYRVPPVLQNNMN